MKFHNHKRLGSIKAWEAHLLAAARRTSLDVGGPVPANLVELLEIIELAIVTHPVTAKPMSGVRDEVLELLRLKERRRELLKMPVPQRVLHLIHDEGLTTDDEIIERCVSGDYGRISAKQARAALGYLMAHGLIEADPGDTRSERDRNTIH